MSNLWVNLDLDELSTRGLEYVQARVKHMREDEENPLTRVYRAHVPDLREGDLEVDENAVVSMSEDDGAYVMCWKWVSNEDAGIETPEEAR
jgi:hypothetical protein